ncbi:CLIP domain-containing serine protease 2-like [Maniola jurtina]|uniref:CLIP domain-containing serine protease 2-like n=1 Tax=Maniola jurtina TaxID=191418 RepID=UPI001E68D8B1|nr:CLIP domain-containing serine protease 2-like [Maniola jurtina]
MDFLCRSFIILSFLAVLSTNVLALKACSGNARCVVFEDCKGLYTPLTRVASPHLLDLLKHLQCGFNEDRQPMICCPPILSFYPESSTSAHAAFDREAALALLPGPSSCGVDRADRIYGGSQTEVDEHPWMALIRYDKLVGSGFYCGGVLISSRYVLTAAHCIKGAELPKQWKVTHVRLGEWSTSTVIDCVQDDCNEPPLDVPVEEIVVHEDYVPSDGHQQNDIALLRLAYDVPFNDFVKPICLPTDPSLAQKTFQDTDMEVAGWGKTEISFSSAVKLKARLPVVSNYICSQIYKVSDRNISEKQICAGGTSHKDSCRGDSGGPLMAQDSAMNWMVLGVVSYGPSPCGSPGWPGVYTRVTAFVDWILTQLRP